MRKAILFLIPIILISCGKAKDFCPTTDGVTGFATIPANNNPNNTIAVELTYEFTLDISKTMFAFSVPDVFKTPRNDGRTIAVSKASSFAYELKDPANPPASVQIFGYAFNDCGEGRKVYATITYNTTP